MSTPEKNGKGPGGPDISEYIPGYDLKNKPATNGKGTLSSWNDWPQDATPKNKTEHPFNQVLNIVLLPFFFLLLMVPWSFGVVAISMVSVHQGFYFWNWTLFFLGFFILICASMFHTKILRWIACLVMLVVVAVSSVFRAWTWWTVDRFPVMTQEINWFEYKPFTEDNKLVKVEVPAQYALDVDDPFPRLNGAYALYPIYAAMAQGMYPETVAGDYKYLRTDGSNTIYDELLKGERDLIFALAPSIKQEVEAKQAGVQYKLTPFCMDAFVFYVNAKNPVDNLTTEQIRGIYSGKITNWKEVGAPSSTKIIPFQRNEGSGSQTTLQKLMDDTPIMPPLKEDRLGGMGDIINDTANYRNYNAALGFSFRYYSTEMLRNNQIKLLSIDGVAPTVENIRNGSYPLVTTVYMVTARPRSKNTQKIVDYMLSPEGQKLVEDTGYVSLGTHATAAP